MARVKSSLLKSFVVHIRDISKMSVASFLATSFDFTIFTIMVGLLEVQTPRAAALGALAGGVLHFTICRFWVFGHLKRDVVDAALRYAIVSGTALILHSLATTVLAKYFFLKEIAWLISKNLVFACWVYPANRYVVFGEVHTSVADGWENEKSLVPFKNFCKSKKKRSGKK